MRVCPKFQLSSWSRSGWKVCAGGGGVGSTWLQCRTPTLVASELLWVELSYLWGLTILVHLTFSCKWIMRRLFEMRLHISVVYYLTCLVNMTNYLHATSGDILYLCTTTFYGSAVALYCQYFQRFTSQWSVGMTWWSVTDICLPITVNWVDN